MAKYWVTMTDKWAPVTQPNSGKKVFKIVFECESLLEADKVREIAYLKIGMTRINISRRKPHYHLDHYSTTYYTRETAKSGWYPIKEDKPDEV